MKFTYNVTGWLLILAFAAAILILTIIAAHRDSHLDQPQGKVNYETKTR